MGTRTLLFGATANFLTAFLVAVLGYTIIGALCLASGLFLIGCAFAEADD